MSDKSVRWNAKGSQFRSWRWWIVVLFVVPPTVLLMLPIAFPASVLPWMADKAERLDYWWQTKIHGVVWRIFAWEKRKRDAENEKEETRHE